MILNYEIVAAHREALGRRRLQAVVIDESHYCKNPKAKRTQAVRRLAASVTGDGLRLALTGTPVLNHADELIAQLRAIGRFADFGSGSRFSRQFHGDDSVERLHWHLRRRCFVRRLKQDVLPQLPAKRQVVVPIALSNEPEYRLAERDVIAWLREQPLDLGELDAKIASTLRAERLAQLGTLQRLAARGKLHGALSLDPRLPRVGRAARRVRPPRRGPGGRPRAVPRRRPPAGAGRDRRRGRRRSRRSRRRTGHS